MIKRSEGTTGGGKTRTVATLVATVAVLGALLVPMLVGSPAGASPSHLTAGTVCTTYPSGACPTTTSGPTTIPVISVASVGLQATAPKSSSLAFTGTDIALLLIAAALLILLGYATVRVTKQRRHVH